MASFTLEGLNKISDWLSKAEKFLAVATSFVVAGVSAYIGIFKDAWKFLSDKLLAIDPNSIGQVNFNVIDGISYVNAVFPLSEVIGLYTIYFTAWVVLILVRWVKSFIPTVAN